MLKYEAARGSVEIDDMQKYRAVQAAVKQHTITGLLNNDVQRAVKCVKCSSPKQPTGFYITVVRATKK